MGLRATFPDTDGARLINHLSRHNHLTTGWRGVSWHSFGRKRLYAPRASQYRVFRALRELGIHQRADHLVVATPVFFNDDIARLHPMVDIASHHPWAF